MLGGLTRAAFGLGIVVAVGSIPAKQGIAGVQDSVFFVSPDGSNVAFDVRDVPRREVLQRLLQSRAIEFEWIDPAFADERISGAFSGNTESVLRRLLAQTDFVVVYDRGGAKPRIARLIVVGKSASPSWSVAVGGIITPVPTQGLAPAPVLAPAAEAAPASRSIAITPPSPADLAASLIWPLPIQAPPLVPPSNTEKAIPLLLPRGPISR